MTEEFLEHYGVKGMQWGKRKADGPRVPGRVDRAARKDAKEFTQAKMYYGEGAGTRRRLIKNTVTERSKDPLYKQAFDTHVSNTDMNKRVAQAKSKRARTDTVNSTRKTARGVTHVLSGNTQYASAAAIAAVGVGTAAYKLGIHKTVAKAAKTSLRAQQIKREFAKGGWKF